MDIRIFSYLPNPRVWKALIAAELCGVEVEVVAQVHELFAHRAEVDAGRDADDHVDPEHRRPGVGGEVQPDIQVAVSLDAKKRTAENQYEVIQRYKMYPSATINGDAAPGYSSGDALALMEELADANLPTGMGFEWTGMSYQEKQVGSEQYLIFVLAVVFVFLVLAAQYESWTNPAAVILVVPLALLGVVLGVFARSFDNNVYTQIGIVLLIALASKNAILIVEFARELRAKGKSVAEAAIEAAHLRFRPILMTSFAFILGVVPLVIASGAGAASRQALGTAVFAGMIAATLFNGTFVPVFYTVFQGLSERLTRKSRRDASAEVTSKPERA